MGFRKLLFILGFAVIFQFTYAQIGLKIDYGLLCDSVVLSLQDTTPTSVSRKWFVNGSLISGQRDTTYKVGPGANIITLEINGVQSKDDTIKVHNSPTANFNISKLNHTGYFARFFTDLSILDTSLIDDSYTYTYTIDFDDGETTTHQNPDNGFFHKYGDTGTYNVQYIVSDNLLCADTVTKTITINDTVALYAPNVFTPNHDDVNDIFILEGNGITNLKIEIFNRQGILIYRNTAPIIIWDGNTLSGTEAPSGIYYYILTSDGSIYQNEPIKSALYLFRDK